MRPSIDPALSVSFRFDPTAEHVGSVSRFVKELSQKYIADADAIWIGGDIATCITGTVEL